jgi:hypothetical protein
MASIPESFPRTYLDGHGRGDVEKQSYGSSVQVVAHI